MLRKDNHMNEFISFDPDDFKKYIEIMQSIAASLSKIAESLDDITHNGVDTFINR